MIIKLKNNTDKHEIGYLTSALAALGLSSRTEDGGRCIFADSREAPSESTVGKIKELCERECVEEIRVFHDPFLCCGRGYRKERRKIKVSDGVTIGGENFCLIAGPCSVESLDSLTEIAQRVKSSGADILRGGAFKPRTSPYEFQGLHEEGIKLLCEVGRYLKIPVVSEIMSENQLELFADVDVIQVGARNMQNFELLRALGKSSKPILLKRGMSAEITEFLMSAEYIMSAGNENVILCERGIRTFEPRTRNTLDLSAVTLVHELSCLPIITDPSHASGHSPLVKPLALASAAAGADGIMTEVHSDPKNAKSDGVQSITTDEFDSLAHDIREVRAAVKNIYCN